MRSGGRRLQAGLSSRLARIAARVRRHGCSLMGDVYAILIAAGCFACILALLWSLERV